MKFQILKSSNKVAPSCICSYSAYQTVPINLTYDGSSFLQVVLCYQLHISLPPPHKKDAPCPLLCTRTHSHTDKQTHGGHRGTDTCRLFVTSSVDICDSEALWEEKAIWCQQGWIRREQAGAKHHAALFCPSEVCKVLCRQNVIARFSSYGS